MTLQLVPISRRVPVEVRRRGPVKEPEGYEHMTQRDPPTAPSRVFPARRHGSIWPRLTVQTVASAWRPDVVAVLSHQDKRGPRPGGAFGAFFWMSLYRARWAAAVRQLRSTYSMFLIVLQPASVYVYIKYTPSTHIGSIVEGGDNFASVRVVFYWNSLITLSFVLPLAPSCHAGSIPNRERLSAPPVNKGHLGFSGVAFSS